MNQDLLETLMDALQTSPENHLPRKQIVQGLFGIEGWNELETVAPPLLHIALVAMKG